MFGTTREFPAYLMHGLGQDTSTVIPDWITGVVKPIANVFKEYFDIEYQQRFPQPVVRSSLFTTSTGGVSPLVLIGGGILLLFLLKGKKSKKGGD